VAPAGPYAAARIARKSTGMRLAYQFGLGAIFIGLGAWGHSKMPKLSTTSAGIGGGFLLHGATQGAIDHIMPMLFKAKTNLHDDDSLGARLYPEKQEQAQKTLEPFDGSEKEGKDAAGALVASMVLFPWVALNKPIDLPQAAAGNPEAFASSLYSEAKRSLLRRVPGAKRLFSRSGTAGSLYGAPEQAGTAGAEPSAVAAPGQAGVDGCNGCKRRALLPGVQQMLAQQRAAAQRAASQPAKMPAAQPAARPVASAAALMGAKSGTSGSEQAAPVATIAASVPAAPPALPPARSNLRSLIPARRPARAMAD